MDSKEGENVFDAKIVQQDNFNIDKKQHRSPFFVQKHV